MTKKVGLRVAIIWEGAVVQERMFRADKGERVVFSGDPEVKRAMVIPDYVGTIDGLIPDGDGYKVRFPSHATGSITRDGKEEPLEKVIEDARKVGTVSTLEGDKDLYEIHVEEGDWGLITLNEVSIYFQLRDATLAAPITAFSLPIQAPLAASILISAVIHGTILMLILLTPERDPELVQMRALDRFASFMVDDVSEPPEEEEIPADQPIEEDTTAKKAGGEEGKFGDEDSDFEDSKLAKSDGKMADHIDVKNIGINKALSSKVLGSGALKNVFGDSAGLDASMDAAIAMGGEAGSVQIGRGAGGMGAHGLGKGGGGEGLGRIGGMGDVDTGGGKGVTGAKLGKRKVTKRTPKMAKGTPSLGDFCDRGNIGRVINAKSRAIRYCFEKALQSNPSLSGKITASWQIGLDGGVMNASIASSTLNNKEVEGCVTRLIKTLRFQKPSGGICVIKYPFVFTGIE